MSSNRGCLAELITLILAIAMVVFIVCGMNSCSAEEWNDGTCAKCDTRYELRGVSYGTKYYVCPDCGNEIQRHWIGG